MTVAGRVRTCMAAAAAKVLPQSQSDDDGRLVVEASDGTIASYGVGDIVHLRPEDDSV